MSVSLLQAFEETEQLAVWNFIHYMVVEHSLQLKKNKQHGYQDYRIKKKCFMLSFCQILGERVIYIILLQYGL